MAATAFAIALFLIFVHLGDLPLLQPDEGRNAEVAREMQASSAWLIPTYDGLTYLDKPSLYFRAVALSFDAFGQSEATARLPSAIAALLLLGVVFMFLRHAYDDRTAAVAVVVITTSPLFLAFARIVIFDMLLALFVTLAIFAGYCAERSSCQFKRWYFLAWLSMGFATLTKGPVGLILPILVLTVFNALEGKIGTWKRLFHPFNLIVFGAVVMPWFISVTVKHPDFAYYGLVKESLDRLTTNDFGRTRPFYFYVPVIVGTFFPWSLLIPEGLILAWRQRMRWRSPDRLFAAWAVVVVLFFSLPSSKLPGYVLTAIVALGVLVARGAAHALANEHSNPARSMLRASLALGVIGLVGGILIAVDVLNPAFAGVLYIHSRYVAALRPALSDMAICLMLTALVSLVAAAWRRPRFAFVGFMVLPVLLTTVGLPAFRDYAASHSTRALANRFEDIPTTVRIVCLECYPNGVSFYLKRPVTVVTRHGSELTSNYIKFALKRSAVWPSVLVPVHSFKQWLATRRQPIYLLARGQAAQALRKIAAKYGTAMDHLPGGYRGVLVAHHRRG